MSDLTKKKCEPCEIGTAPLKMEQLKVLLPQVPGWMLIENKIARQFEFKDFIEAMKFINKLADLAEAEGHHPDIHIFYNKVKLELWTHNAKGLTENDFILAAKINQI